MLKHISIVVGLLSALVIPSQAALGRLISVPTASAAGSDSIVVPAGKAIQLTGAAGHINVYLYYLTPSGTSAFGVVASVGSTTTASVQGTVGLLGNQVFLGPCTIGISSPANVAGANAGGSLTYWLEDATNFAMNSRPSGSEMMAAADVSGNGGTQQAAVPHISAATAAAFVSVLNKSIPFMAQMSVPEEEAGALFAQND